MEKVKCETCDQLRAELDEAKEQLTLARNQGREYAAQDVATLRAEVERLKEQVKIRDIMEVCSQCGKGWNPSYVESGWCMSCIIQDVKKNRDQWRAVAERLAQNLVNCMGHVSGEHKHWKEGYNTIASYEKLKGESK